MIQLTPKQYQKNYDNLELEVEQIKDSFLEDIFLSDEQEELLNQLINKSINLGIYNKEPLIASLKTEIESLKAQLARYENPDYVLVPRIPTKKMIIAGHGQWLPQDVYKAMIEAQGQGNDSL